MFLIILLLFLIVSPETIEALSVGSTEKAGFVDSFWDSLLVVVIVLSLVPICSVLAKSRAYECLFFWVISNLVLVVVAECSKDGYCVVGEERKQLTLDDCLKIDGLGLNDSVCFVSDVKEGCNWTERVAVEPQLAWLEFCLDLEDSELSVADQKWVDRKLKVYDQSSFAKKLVVLKTVANGFRARYSSVGLKGVERMLNLYRYVCARRSYVWPVVMDYLLVGRVRDATYIEFKADVSALGPVVVELLDWRKLSVCAAVEVVGCYALVVFGPKSVRQHRAWLLISAITIGICVSVW